MRGITILFVGLTLLLPAWSPAASAGTRVAIGAGGFASDDQLPALRVAAAGDIACNASTPPSETTCHQDQTSDLMVGQGLSAVLPLGDTQYEKGVLSDFNSYYDPTWGRLFSVSHPVVGNHEYETPGASGYFSYFGPRAGDPDKGYYSFNVGSWHMVALNSNCSEVSCVAGSAQEVWLKNDLASDSHRCTLAYWHHPYWATGSGYIETRVRPLVDDLYSDGVEILLTGHAHHYERFAPQDPNGNQDPDRGIREFIVGTGGRSLAGFTDPAPNSEKRGMKFGVLGLALRSSSFSYRFVPEAGATFSDSGGAICH